MAKGDGKAKQATRTNSKIFVDGGEVSMTAYNIGGSNYFKLRDVMQIFDIRSHTGSAPEHAKITFIRRINDSDKGSVLTGQKNRYRLRTTDNGMSAVFI